MKYLLDTNACIAALRRRGSAPVLARMQAAGADGVAVCSVVRMELVFGALRSARPEENLKRVHDFLGPIPSLALDDVAADAAANIRAALEGQGTPIGANDVLIAAIALANRLILVTGNTAEFSRVRGLAVEDWGKPG